MALPVSIGDALMLSKLAYRLGQAFTTGRKSAPAEFEDVQNLLCSLSRALELLSRDLPDGSSSSSVNAEDNVLFHIVQNCRSTLTHLESVVAKYAILEIDSIQPQRTRLKSWSEDVRRNWKKVVWTKEGGDLMKLKGNLTAHTNCLTLAVSAATRHQGAVSQERINTIHSKLDEIHQWFAVNLQARESEAPRRVRAESRQQKSLPSHERPPFLAFCVSKASTQSPSQELICPIASFSDQWLSDAEADVLPVSFLVQNVEPLSRRSWQMYAGSPRSNMPVSLFLTDVPPKHLAKFEAYIVELAVSQAALYARQGLSSMLISHSASNSQAKNVSVLVAKVPTSNMDSPVSSTFTSNGYRFSPGQVESIQLLSYGMLPETSSSGLSLGLDSAQAMQRHPHAELILQCTNPESGVGNETRYIIQIDHHTKITARPSPTIVCLENVFCISEGDANDEFTPFQIKCSTIDFQLPSTSAVESFTTSLHAMQRELSILYLQYPRFGEQVVYQHAAGDLMVRHCYLTKAHLSLVFNTLSQEYRMILLSGCHSVSVCLELPQSFLQDLASATHPPNRNYPAWFVEVTENGTNISKQSAGIESLLSLQGTATSIALPQPIELPIRGTQQDEDSEIGDRAL
ncbi:uncharacterized protein BDZ99DRAFT_501776 [Mytilinidion resinicola]|uniref:Fungal N-terminal domain-containing protein n=1 Tax=Mytilinidion resinicola TaxID=574789 RepID=A0A6A6Y9S9_9PEZI|nr:uncharacterized protein BDZ99DRAFT_501776 [Mytilinidion resinicola]KAF2805582.1 hypothetical protein BDZ99DRAFT_501776 [Mytilinidion resinicola]